MDNATTNLMVKLFLVVKFTKKSKTLVSIKMISTDFYCQKAYLASFFWKSRALDIWSGTMNKDFCINQCLQKKYYHFLESSIHQGLFYLSIVTHERLQSGTNWTTLAMFPRTWIRKTFFNLDWLKNIKQLWTKTLKNIMNI